MSKLSEKLCECGCGHRVSLSQITNKKLGLKKGEPRRFVSGHNSSGGEFKPIPFDGRFWAKVQRGEGCWTWTGNKNKRGYGLIRKGERNNYLAHRASWELAFGEIPDGLEVCHECDNPSCVRPDHLFVGTHRDNMNDAKAKGRTKNGASTSGFIHHNSIKTHCHRGHLLSGDNLFTRPDGRRECRTCRRQSQRAYEERKRVRIMNAGDLGGVELL